MWLTLVTLVLWMENNVCVLNLNQMVEMAMVKVTHIDGYHQLTGTCLQETDPEVLGTLASRSKPLGSTVGLS